MLDAQFIISCDYCGETEEAYIPSIDGDIVVNDAIIHEVVKAKFKWGYFEEEDHFMCSDCLKKPQAIKISDLEIMNASEIGKTIGEDALNMLIRRKIREKFNLNSDDISIKEVEIKCYTNPNDMNTEVRIRPINCTWEELKKRHPAKE